MQIKDGDYFSYSWKSGIGPSSDPYWCRDRRCVARTDKFGDVVLIDTFNYWPYKDGKEDKNIFTHEGLSRDYSKYINIESFDLEFICNLNDYEFVREYSKNDYEGVIFVGYQCTKQWAKPKGVETSITAIRKKYENKIREAEEKKRSAEWDIQYYSGLIQELE